MRFSRAQTTKPSSLLQPVSILLPPTRSHCDTLHARTSFLEVVTTARAQEVGITSHIGAIPVNSRRLDWHSLCDLRTVLFMLNEHVLSESGGT